MSFYVDRTVKLWRKSCMFLGACAMRTHNNSSQALYQPLILKYGVVVSSDQDRNCQVQKMTF